MKRNPGAGNTGQHEDPGLILQNPCYYWGLEGLQWPASLAENGDLQVL